MQFAAYCKDDFSVLEHFHLELYTQESERYSKVVFEKQTNSSRMFISGQQLVILCSTKTKRGTVGYDTLSEISSLELSRPYDGSL